MIYQTTISENITFGLPELPGAVEKAARDAEISEVIERLPDGYDTIIGGDYVTRVEWWPTTTYLHGACSVQEAIDAVA